jgi:hypothetical protein
MKTEEWCSMSFSQAMTTVFALEMRPVIFLASLFQNYVSGIHFPMVGTVLLPAPKLR